MATRSSGDTQALEAFGARLRALRLRAGLSQEQLADAAGLHRTYVGSTERGERNVGLLNMIALAKAVKTSPADLLSWD